jgi:hypothetical protein
MTQPLSISIRRETVGKSSHQTGYSKPRKMRFPQVDYLTADPKGSSTCEVGEKLVRLRRPL